MDFIVVVMFLIAIGLGGVVGYYATPRFDTKEKGDSKKEIEAARKKAEEIRRESAQKLEDRKAAMEREEQGMAETVESMMELITQKETLLEKKQERNKEVEMKFEGLKGEQNKLEEDIKSITSSLVSSLTETAGISQEKAKEEILSTLKEVIERNKEQRHKAELEEFEEEVSRHAKAVLQIVIQRLGVQSSVDRNTTAVKVKDDKFKGMLIGKGGANIAHLETLLPVAVIFNLGDPMTIYVGGVNLIRRHIAKGAIQRLQRVAKKHGKLTHKDINEAVAASEKDIMANCDRKGRWALKQMGLNPKDTPEELVNYIGRLYYRTSYGQNIILHSLEMAYAARLIAEIIDVDVNTSMQATFYHDIGKAIDHDVGGSHDDLSKEILEKHNYSPEIVHAAYAHHDKVPCLAPADFIVKAADAISGGRPGARMETVTNYFERMKQLHDCAIGFKGVKRVSTMSAGREVRAEIDQQRLKDADMEALAENIAVKISDEVSFPGIIKVNLIRKTRSVDYARDKQKRKSHA